MEFDEYQDMSNRTAMYPKDQAMSYLTLGLAGEAGEVADKVKKLIRDKGGVENMTQEDKDAILDEIGDTMWYQAQLIGYLGTDMGTVAKRNIEKLRNRMENNKIGGSGDER